METSPNFSALLNRLSEPRRSKHISEIASYLESIPALSKILRIKGPATLKQFILKSNLITIHTNEDILDQQTQFPIGFHVLLQGKISIYSLIHLRNQEKQLRAIGVFKPGDIFGHIKEYQTLAIAKLVATQKCTILKLSINYMYRLLDGVFIFPQLISRLEQLKRISILKELDKKDLLKIIEHSKKVTYAIHQTIFKEGDEVDNLLILEKGQVELYKVGKRFFRKQKFVDKLPICILFTAGDLLGIEEMMQNKRYKCYAQSISSSAVITQIPIEIVRGLLKNSTQEQPKQFKIQSKCRDSRVHTMVQFSQKMNKNQEISEIRKGRLCFQDKNKIMSSEKSMTTRSSYISNKANQRAMFDNQEDFYTHKIRKLQKFAISKYGKEFKAKFISLFGNDFLPPKKVTKDTLFRKTTRTHGAITSARQNPQDSQEKERSMSCGFYRLKKKVFDGKVEGTQFTKTMNAWA